MSFLDKYKCSFILGLQRSLEYRTDFFINLLSVLFPMIVQIFLWTAVFGSSNEDKVYGYTYKQLIIYTLLAGLVTKLISTGFEHEINDDIKNGGLNKYIVRPINYFPYRLCCFFGSKVFSMFILFSFTIFLICVLSFTFGYLIEPGRIAFFLLSMLLATILNILIYYSISMVAFWASEVSRLFITINIILVVISGGIFPLEIFGQKFVFVMNILPFKYTTQFPVDIISGKISNPEILKGFMVQGIWIFLTMFLSGVLWKNGLKKYIAIGG